MIKFKKTLFFIIFFYCGNIFSNDLIEIRSGHNNNKYRIVFEFKDEIKYKKEIKSKTLKLFFNTSDRIKNLSEFKKIQNVSDVVFDQAEKSITLFFSKKINAKNFFIIKKDKQNKNFRIVFDYNIEKLKKKIVIIDAGHGGKDSGAVGASKILEKNVTLSVAKKFAKRCNKDNHFKCLLTRNGDYFLNLRQRVKFARQHKGDIFISLHADFHPKKNVRGVSVYTLSEKASDKEAEALAKRENKSDLIDGLDLSEESKEVRNILIDLTQRETMNRSTVYVMELINQFKTNTNLLKRAHRFAGFAVLKAPDIPSVLLEMGYLSNKNDAKLLTSEIYQKKIVENIYIATLKYFNK